MFQYGPIACNIDVVDVIREYYKMRVAHRYECASECTVAGFHFAVSHCSVGGGQLAAACQGGSEHVHRHAFCRAVNSQMQTQRLYARECQQTYLRKVCQSLVVQIFADASRCIAAHHGFRTVGIEDSHGEVGFGYWRFVYKHQSVTADAFMAVAPFYGSRLRIVYTVQRGVYVYIVVAGSVHLGELDGFAHFGSLYTLIHYILISCVAKVQ